MPRLRGDFGRRQLQLDAVLGAVPDVWRVHEAGAVLGLDHEAVEDVRSLVREHLLDGSDSPPLAIVHGRAGGERLIGDRPAWIGVCLHDRRS